MSILVSIRDPAQEPVIPSGGVAVAATFAGFTRAQYSGKNGRVHIESSCNRCNFRVAETDSDELDPEEQAHVANCQGLGAE